MSAVVESPTGYAPLDASRVPAYLDAHPELRAIVPGPELQVREVGDGNLNLVFVVRDDPDRPGIVLKQSLPYVRVHGESWPLTIERVRHEADAYRAYAPFAGDVIPRIHGFDAERYVLEGTGEVTVGGVTRPVKKGDVWVIPANTPHGGQFEDAPQVLFISSPIDDPDNQDRVWID